MSNSVITNWLRRWVRNLLPILANLGITFMQFCPHTHQQHDRAERKHRTITKFGLTLLARAQMPLKFWWDAFVSAAFLINRLRSASSFNKSPFEYLYNHKLDYIFLKVFGYSCFPLLRPHSTHRFDFRSYICLFMGYSPNHKGYHHLHPTGRIYITRNVIFYEYEFPYFTIFKNVASLVVPYFQSKHNFELPVIVKSSYSSIDIGSPTQTDQLPLSSSSSSSSPYSNIPSPLLP